MREFASRLGVLLTTFGCVLASLSLPPSGRESGRVAPLLAALYRAGDPWTPAVGFILLGALTLAATACQLLADRSQPPV